MPMASATCWLSATARIAMPLRDFRKNQPKATRKPMLTPAPSSWMGGMNSGPTRKGSSRIGSGSGFVPEKIVNGPTPRRIDASPMVAMTTAMTGRPMSRRSMTRSSTKPREISEYIRPISTPLDSRRAVNCQSTTDGRLLRVLQADARLDDGLPAVLVRDVGGQLHLVAAAVEGVDHRRVLLGHEAPAHLARARHLRVVGLEVLREQQEPPHLSRFGKRLVALADLFADQRAHLGLAAEVHVRRVGDAASLGPVTDRVHVDGDHGRHERPLVAEGDRLADERAELELVLDELRRERRAVDQRPHVLGAVDDDEVAARVDEARVTGVEPALVVDDLACGLVVLEVAAEDAGALHEHLAPLRDLHLDARTWPPGRGRVGLPRRLHRHQARGLRGAVDLLEVHADRAEEAERVGPERRAAGQRPARAAQAELITL